MRDQYRLQIEGFGANHPNTIVAKSEYAYHLVNYEDDVTGEILLTELLKCTKSVLGPTHFLTPIQEVRHQVVTTRLVRWCHHFTRCVVMT